MEYRHARWDEAVDEGLVRGHEWRIFPLTHRRALFADVENFRLYDFYISNSGGAGGTVNEDVFAYSNYQGNDRALVVYFTTVTRKPAAGSRPRQPQWTKPAGTSSKRAWRKRCTCRASLMPFSRIPYPGWNTSGLAGNSPKRGYTWNWASYQCHVFLDWHFVNGEEWAEVNRNPWWRWHGFHSIEIRRAVCPEAKNRN